MADLPPEPFDFSVVGCGRMGASIAGYLALCGARVCMYDKSEFDRKKGFDIMKGDMKANIDRKLCSPEDRDAALGRVAMVETLPEVLNARVLIEVIYEDLQAKRDLFKQLENAALTSACIFASNSMNYTADQIFKGSISDKRVYCGLRFLHPVFYMKAVEISGAENSMPDRLQPVMGLLADLGIEPFYVHAQEGGLWRRKLTQNEVDAYESMQKLRTEKRTGLGQGGVPAKAPTKVTLSSDVACIICMEREADCVLAPCGHDNLCRDCAEALMGNVVSKKRVCPTCRGHIDRVLDID